MALSVKQTYPIYFYWGMQNTGNEAMRSSQKAQSFNGATELLSKRYDPKVLRQAPSGCLSHAN